MEKLAEQKIRSVPKSQKSDGVLKIKLHINGFQIILKLIKNDLDNLLFDYSYGCSLVNFPMLKLLFPNLLRIGRNNSEASNEPITMLKSLGSLADWIVGIHKSFSKWSGVVSESLLVDDVMHFKLYPKQYPVLCPNQKKTEFVDVPDRGWNTFKKQSEEMNKYNYVFPA